jgi:hypothetical protein
MTLEVAARCHPQDPVAILYTPVTPVSAGAVASLHDLIKADTHTLNEASKYRIQRHLQKLTNATQLSFAECALLQEQVKFLATTNNEAKIRRVTRSTIIGTARVMSFEDLEKARAERAAKEAEKEAKKARQTSKSNLTVEETTVGKVKRSRKRKDSAKEDVPKPEAGTMGVSQAQVEGAGNASDLFRAPSSANVVV